MPTYSYYCKTCNHDFELFFYIKDYIDRPECDCCKSNKSTQRLYNKDILSQSASVKKSDNELKTLGDLANRNRDRMSQDQIENLEKKHNEYKEQESTKSLPKGMTRIKKPGHKIKWT